MIGKSLKLKAFWWRSMLGASHAIRVVPWMVAPWNPTWEIGAGGWNVKKEQSAL